MEQKKKREDNIIINSIWFSISAEAFHLVYCVLVHFKSIVIDSKSYKKY